MSGNKAGNSGNSGLFSFFSPVSRFVGVETLNLWQF